MLSDYPKLYDQFYIVSEMNSGTPTSEERIIPDNCTLDLKNYAKASTIVISGFTEVFSENDIVNKTFYVEDYHVPPETLSFEVGRRLKFHSMQQGGKYTIAYDSCGTNITETRINQIQDSIMKIENALGLGKSLFGLINLVYKKLQTHDHTRETRKLTHSSVNEEVLVNANFDSNANISRSKIDYV